MRVRVLILCCVAPVGAFAGEVTVQSGGASAKLTSDAETVIARPSGAASPIVARATGPGSVVVGYRRDMGLEGARKAPGQIEVLVDGKAQQVPIEPAPDPKAKVKGYGGTLSQAVATTIQLSAGSHVIEVKPLKREAGYVWFGPVIEERATAPEAPPVAATAPAEVEKPAPAANPPTAKPPEPAKAEAVSPPAEAPESPTPEVALKTEAVETTKRPPVVFGAIKLGGALPQIFSNHLSPTFTLAAEADWLSPLELALGRLALELELAYSNPFYTNTVSDTRLPGGSYTYTTNEQALGIFVGPKYFILPADRTIVPWASLGVRIQFIDSHLDGSASGAEFGTVDETGTHLAFVAQIGGGYRLGPGLLCVELQLLSSVIRHLVTGRVNIGDLDLRLGYSLTY
jgi:hypothetical protein